MKSFIGLLPWVIFWVVSGPNTWELGAVLALVAALVLVVPDAQHHKIKMLDIVSIVFFAALTIAGLILDAGQLTWLEDYSQAISSAVLALIVLGSLLWVPFTAQYARDEVPAEFWDTPDFKRINLVLSTVWGLVFLACAVLGFMAQDMAGSGNTLLNWVIPVILIVIAVKFTAWYPEQGKGNGAAPA